MWRFSRTPLGRNAAVLAVVVVAAGACSEGGANGTQESGARPNDSSDHCYELGWRNCPDEPYPFSTPLPPAEPTALDGTYTRVIEKDLAWAPGKCRRCPPYRLEPGPETLTFDRGRYFVNHEPPGFKSSGHYWLEDGQLQLFNDPSCVTFEGVYEWEIAGGVLSLTAIDDQCPFTKLRQRYLMAKDWQVVQGGTADAPAECEPPSEEAAVTGHWPIPKGCEAAGKS